MLRISHHGGSARQVGCWVVPKRMEVQVTGGNVRLDFAQAVISNPVLQIDAHVRGGNLVIVTRPGVVVDAAEVSMIGGRCIIRTARGPQPPDVLTVQVSGEVWGGNIRARARRRTFPRLLRRADHSKASRPGLA